MEEEKNTEYIMDFNYLNERVFELKMNELFEEPSTYEDEIEEP